MSGKCAGVKSILRQNHMPNGIYIHCHTHKLNLVIVDVIKIVKYINEFYQIVSKIHFYFTSSSITNEYYQIAQQKLALTTTLKLKTWSDIRWDSRWSSIDARGILSATQVDQNGLVDGLFIDGKRCQNGVFTAVNRPYLPVISGTSHDHTVRTTAPNITANFSPEDSRKSTVNGRIRTVLFDLDMEEPIFIVTLLILNKLLGFIKILSDQLKDDAKLQFIFTKEFLFFTSSDFLFLGESIDYTENQSLIKSVIEQFEYDRNESSFKIIYCDVLNLLRNAFITSTIGHRKEITSEDDYRDNIYYPLIDAILIEMRDRFSPSNIALLSTLSSVSPQNKSFLNYDLLLPLASHINCDRNYLFNEIQVLKPMLDNKNLSSISELYHDLMPLQQAFPNTMLMIKAALTIPVSSSTCERVFSKMKLIKTRIRTTMADKRLSDLCILSIERDFQMDYEQVIDQFSINHNISRIMLR
ncbi:unnamed protein product [Rotaria magnacalcarata]|nr:unnamed protein product [Rotaria magnacalcarata]CAF3766370.1 unnamed protein product [Rotaria magnacalcarata]